MTDERETLDPRWEIMSRERSELVWEIAYQSRMNPSKVLQAEGRLSQWDARNAEEWNERKPWFEKRLTTGLDVDTHGTISSTVVKL